MRADDLFEHATGELIAAIEAGAGEWHMPWHTLASAGTPESVDRRPYRGLNALLLAMTADSRGWTSGTWATYRAWQRHGAQVRRGVHATTFVLWKQTIPRGDPSDADQTSERPRLFARPFAVFAAEQVDGADEISPDDVSSGTRTSGWRTPAPTSPPSAPA